MTAQALGRPTGWDLANRVHAAALTVDSAFRDAAVARAGARRDRRVAQLEAAAVSYGLLLLRDRQDGVERAAQLLAETQAAVEREHAEHAAAVARIARHAGEDGAR